MRNLALLAGGVAAMCTAVPAAAVTAVSQCESGAATCAITFDGTAGTFRNSAVSNSSFTDVYTFDIAGDGLLNFTLSSSYPGLDLSQDVDFSLVSLTGPGGVNSTLTSLTPEPTAFYLLNNLAVTAGQYMLRLEGTAGNGSVVNASYAGTLNFTAGAIPEPTTWALLLVGFGLVGTSLRARRRVGHANA